MEVFDLFNSCVEASEFLLNRDINDINQSFEPYCLLRTPRMAGTIKPGGVDNERKTI